MGRVFRFLSLFKQGSSVRDFFLRSFFIYVIHFLVHSIKINAYIFGRLGI